MIHDLSDSSAAPASFGPFRVLHQIGVGVLGPVYRAQDSVRDQLVAVKAFKVDTPPEQAEEIADALRDVAHALPRHRGLLEYIATGVERSTPYLVMAHSDVPSLDTKLKPGVPLDAEEALDLIATLADAIDAAHAKGIIHGTLHPRDVFVDDRGGCRISGFGVARALMGAGIRTLPLRRPYSPPERVVGGAIERSADLFALGALAFELFSGRRVIGTGLDAAVRFAVSAPDVDMEHLRTALAAMLAENPVHRPSSATAFAQAVTQAVRPRGLTPEAGRRRITPSEIKMSAAGAAGAGAGAAGAGAGAARAGAAAAAGAGAGAGAAAARATEQSGPSGSGPETVKLPQEELDAHEGARGDERQPEKAEAEADGPSSDALELFTRQGTVWEANRQPDTEGVRLETVTVAPDEDPLAQFSSESESSASSSASASTSAAPASSTPAAAPAAASQLDTQPIAAPKAARIDDDSTEEEVKSIADAARAVRPASSVSTSTTVPAHAPAATASEPRVPAPAHERDFEYAAGAAAASTTNTPAFDARASAASATAAERASASILIADRDHTHDHDHDHDRVLSGLRGWTPAEEPDSAESSSNPLRALVMVLAIGLAVGVAGGYLLGQRSALRQALALFRGDQSSQTSPSAAEQPSPTAAAPSTAASAAPPTEISEPTPVPEQPEPARSKSASTSPNKSASPAPNESPSASKEPGARKSEQAPRAASAGPARDAAAPSAAAPAAAAASTRGRLVVRSTPARAEVSVNGVRRGETPVTLRDLPFGTHTIRVARNGYMTSTRKVTLSASRTSDALEFDLEPEGRYTRTGAGAAPASGGSSSPAAAGAARDRDRISTAAGGGIMAAGGDPDVEHASAEATAAGLGSLYVLSHPAGARVLVDGQYVGATPLLVTNVPPGTKTIKLELPGHKAWSSSVRVAAGQRVRVAASLEEGTN